MSKWQEIKAMANHYWAKGIDLDIDHHDFIKIAALVDATIAEHEQIKNCETIPCYAGAPCDACMEAVDRTSKAIKELDK